MKTIKIFIFIITLSIISCKKKELPVPKHQEGNLKQSVIPMTSSYKYQIYFSLTQNQIVKSQLKTSWDIAFQSDGKNIILNSSKMMFAYKTNITTYDQVTDTLGFTQNKKYDSPTGNLDSTAIGKWWLDNTVYIIDRGYNELGQHLGYTKLKILNYNNNTFTFIAGNLNSTSTNTYSIQQDTNYNFIGFSFDNYNIIYHEPPKIQWDLLFTQYTEALSQPYPVTGCLINRYKTSATLNKDIPFNNIDYITATQSSLSNHLNIIGYNWKEYDFNTSSFIIYSNYTYIIKNQAGYYFKLRFIDFYNNSGEKGYPTFEFQML